MWENDDKISLYPNNTDEGDTTTLSPEPMNSNMMPRCNSYDAPIILVACAKCKPCIMSLKTKNDVHQSTDKLSSSESHGAFQTPMRLVMGTSCRLYIVKSMESSWQLTASRGFSVRTRCTQQGYHQFIRQFQIIGMLATYLAIALSSKTA
eukprot:scaffold56364_cov18-Prasinocladus_malaysianus.AAC.1